MAQPGDESPGDFRARPAAPGAQTRPAEGRPAYALITGVVASSGGSMPSGHLLLDSASLIHLFSDTSLVTDISPADREMKVITAGGPVYCDTVGRCITTGIWGWIPPDPEDELNIVSYSLAVADGLQPDWCGINECFSLTLDNETVLTFRQRRGLYMHRVGDGHDERPS